MKKSELKALIREVVEETSQGGTMYKIMRHKVKGAWSIPTPPSQEMSYGQAANWVSIQTPGTSLYYIIVPVNELSSELYKKMNLY
jgi:hypothetical protein